MALTAGDPVLSASFAPTPSLGGVAQIGDGSSILLRFAAGAATVYISNSGAGWVGEENQVREVAPSGTPSNFGKEVQLTGKSSFFRGTVIAVMQIELGTTGGTGALTECAMVQSNGGFRYIARVSDLTFL